MQSDPPHILVFDSGIGGLSITQAIQSRIADIEITYLADNKLFPYGLLEEEQLISRVVNLVSALAENNLHSPLDLVVIACNTASTSVLPAIRQRLSLPIVGVVPAIKPAAQISKSKTIGLLATPGTIKRDYTDQLIAAFAKDCRVIKVGSTELVHLAEQKLRGDVIAENTIRSIILPFLEFDGSDPLDTIVLACTHFPLLSKELTAAMPQINHWVDSGEAIARRVESLLEGRKATPQAPLHPLKGKALFTEYSTVTKPLRNYLANMNLDAESYDEELSGQH